MVIVKRKWDSKIKEKKKRRGVCEYKLAVKKIREESWNVHKALGYIFHNN